MSGQTVIVTESDRVTLKESGKTKGRWRVQLIEADVQGSSGFYPAAVLERDGAKAFPAGTQIYLDHPTEDEEWQRPERSVRDLVGVLVSESKYENGSDGHGLFGDMQVFPAFKEDVEAWAPHVGMSIRAMGLRDEAGQVTELIRGESVDIVTRAGAGGRLVTMTEAARQSAGKEPKELYTSLQEADQQALSAVFESVNALTEKIVALEEKAATKEQADVLTPGEIYSKLSGSGLPEVVTKRLANGYKKGVDLDAAIADEKAMVDELMASLKPAEDAKGTDSSGAPEDTEAPATEANAVETPVTESARVGRTNTLRESAKSTDAASTLVHDIFGGGL